MVGRYVLEARRAYPGESKDQKLTDHIEILSFSWGVTQQGAYGTGTGGGAGKAHVQEPTFTHYVDKASTVLFQMCVSGKHIAEGEFIARRAGADGKPQPYMNLKFDDLIVSSVQTVRASRRRRQNDGVVHPQFQKVRSCVYDPGQQGHRAKRQPGEVGSAKECGSLISSLSG